ncbi:YnbE family lipoprotein [uncultured Rhodospira sp.]|uniref:YnbE family lipoprotein n=1 Tax=uncultured Rhodospira sp. TaxID=1936189 RepID=UPI00263625A9|nr:YnbE family lipoprotein [uncultured Rhodospira sp.]
MAAFRRVASGLFGRSGNRSTRSGVVTAGAGALLALAVTACQPSVKVEAPDKPIVINLNVKIEQDVRVRLEKGVEDVLSKNPDIF